MLFSPVCWGCSGVLPAKTALGLGEGFCDYPCMRVLFYEPEYNGHNLAVLGHLVRRTLAMGCEVHLVTSSQVLQSEQFHGHLGSIADDVKSHVFANFENRPFGPGVRTHGPSAVAAAKQSLVRGLNAIKPDHVFFPSGNSIANWAGLPNAVSRKLRRRKIENELILFFGKYCGYRSDWLSRWQTKLSLSMLSRGPYTGIHHIVPRAVEAMVAYNRRLAAISRLVPDSVEPLPKFSRFEARMMLGLPPWSRVVSLVGVIEKRKGVCELLEAFETAIPRLRRDDVVLLAGKATDEVRGWLQGRFRPLMDSGRIFLVDRFLSQDELWAACIGADVVCTPYPSHIYSASILIRAAAARVPSLANDVGWMSETLRRFSLGTLCNTNDRNIFADALVSTLDEAPHFQLTKQAEKFVEYSSVENFAALVTKRLAERMGLDNATTIGWNEVIEPLNTVRAAA